MQKTEQVVEQERRQMTLFEAQPIAQEIAAWRRDVATIDQEIVRMQQQLEDTPLFKAIKCKKEQRKELRGYIAENEPLVTEAVAALELPKP